MKYNIVYFAFISTSYGGVEQKILSQADSLFKLNAGFKLVLIPNSSLEFAFKKETDKRTQYVKVLICKSHKFNNPLFDRTTKFRLIEKELKKHNPNNTIVYMRFPLADIISWHFFKKNKKFKFVTEHQEIENKLKIGIFNGRWYWDINDFIFGKAIRKQITGFVGVTNEILSFQQTYSKKTGTVIGNGINTDSVVLRSPPKYDGKEIRILFVGSGYKSHGLSRLIRSLPEYRNSGIQFKLHIAGNSNEMNTYTKLVQNLRILSDVSFHGYLSGPELDNLFNSCHIAVGNLGMHRIGMKEGSILKLREYCARGIPFFSAPIDSDFNENFKYFLKVELNNNIIDIKEIIEFIKNNYSSSSHHLIMREFAKSHLDWKIKMAKLIDFFNVIMIK